MCNRGFTLLELLFGLVIVAILVTIAVPSYHKSIRKARRADARTALFELQISQERYRGNCIQFAKSLGSSTVCAAATGIHTLHVPSVSPEGHYQLAIQNNSATANGYIATAKALGAQSSDTACALIRLTVNSSNPRGIITPSDCL